jgi:class 3 adenylate cyclase
MAGLETVTILFTDLVGSTALASRVGPERAEELRQEHFALLREAVAAAGGREVKNLGDGLMVSFSSAAGAIECAAAMQQRHELRNRRAEDVLHVRIGMSMGDATHEEGDWFGPPVVEAARLCAKADGGEILLPEVTRIMVGRRGDHTFGTARELELKGIPEPVPTCKLLWEPLPAASFPLPDRLAVIPETSFVGRRKVRARLSEIWEAASGGERRLVLLTGEGGIGKTRLATDLALEAQASGATVLYGHFDEEAGAAYEAWIEALQRLVDYASPETLQAHVAEHGGELSRLVTLPVEDLPTPRTSDPETERYLLFRAVGDLLERAASADPILLFLDDLHWADGASLVLLKHVISNVLSAQLLVLCTYRDAELPAGHPLNGLVADLRRLSGIEWVALEGLEHSEVVEAMEASAGHELDVPGLQLAEALAHETEGNPFFLREMLLHLIESGGVVQGTDGRYVVTTDVASLGLPSGVRDVVGQRVQRLGEEAVQVLRSASVIGRQFDLVLLARVLDSNEESVLDVIESAVDAAVLRESTEVPGRFIFSHALITRTLYGDLTRTRRAIVHRKVAEALEALYGDDPQERLTELAHHWAEATRSVDVPKAVDYARRAGERELQQLAPNVAARWFSQGLEQLSTITDDPRDEERCELLILLGEAQRQSGEPSYRETLLEASALAERIQDADRMARAILANRGLYGWTSVGQADADRVMALEAALLATGTSSAHRSRLLAQLAAEISFEADYESEVRPRIDEALALARGSGDSAELGQVLSFVAFAITSPALIAERVSIGKEFLRTAIDLDDPHLIALASWYSVVNSMEIGEVEHLRADFERLRALSESTRQPALRYIAMVASALEAQLAGEFDRAEELAAEGLGLGMEIGFPQSLLFYGAVLGVIRYEQGRVEEIIDLYIDAAASNTSIPMLQATVTRYLFELGRTEEALANLAQAADDSFPLPLDLLHVQGLARWAECAVLAQDRESAAVLYDRLAPYRSHLVNAAVIAIGSAEMFLGLLATVLERYEDADAHFRTAQATHETMTVPVCQARAQVFWAAMLIHRDPANGARSARPLLAKASEVARRHGATGIENECARVLADVVR